MCFQQWPIHWNQAIYVLIVVVSPFKSIYEGKLLFSRSCRLSVKSSAAFNLRWSQNIYTSGKWFFQCCHLWNETERSAVGGAAHLVNIISTKQQEWRPVHIAREKSAITMMVSVNLLNIYAIGVFIPQELSELVFVDKSWIFNSKICFEFAHSFFRWKQRSCGFNFLPRI